MTVEVTMNNVDFTSDGVRFTYGAAVAVHAVSPYSGPVSGGTVVRVHGEHFTADAALACRFGGTSVSPAVFESESVVSCVAPRGAEPGQGDDRGDGERRRLLERRCAVHVPRADARRVGLAGTRAGARRHGRHARGR